MSRHRDFRNLNISVELEDDALSDGGEEPMSQEDEAALRDAFDQVHAVIGNTNDSSVSDQEIKDTLWNNYFDIGETIQWVIEERERRQVARERKETLDYDQVALEYWKNKQSLPQPEVQSRLPKIILAQQQALEQGYYIEDSLSLNDGRYRPDLSIITERTEMTEPTPTWHSRHLEPSTPRNQADSSLTTSYRELLEDDSQTQRFFPNITAQESASLQPSNAIDSMSVPSIRTSSATTQTKSEPPKPFSASEKPLPIPPPSSKKSKLSMLASSRASTITSLSESSRSEGTALTGSIKTFPILRPTAQSDITPSNSEAPSVPFRDYAQTGVSSTISSTSQATPSQATGVSEMTAQVQKAIKAALELEAMDKNVEPERPKKTLASQSLPHPNASPSHSFRPPPQLSMRQAPQPREPRPDTLGFTSAPKATTPSETVGISHKPALSTRETSRDTKTMSKLAMLAQQKASANRAPKLPEPKTEYLVPTANGPTATTAITTSYQSLYSLTDPRRPAFIPKLDLVPLPADSSAVPDAKRSKLAMKIKRAGEKQAVQAPVESEENVPTLSPIFQVNPSRSRASPSAFASVLVRDDLTLFKTKYKSKDRLAGRSPEDPESKQSSRRMKRNKAPIPDLSLPSTFAFDSPSPDDLIFNARRGTSLARSKQAKTTVTSTLSSKS